MTKKLLWLAPVALAVAFFLLFIKHSTPEHIFLITLDTTRADHIDYTVGSASRTPNLAALAAAGLRYENAYTVIPITFPSHAAMFYSMPPHLFQVFNNGQKRAISRPTLAEIMKKNGYATGAVVSLAVLNRDFGLDKGFDHYLENFRPGFWYKTAAEVNRDAFSLIGKLRDRKSFIWLHYSDPHEPYFPPGPPEKFSVHFGEQILYRGPSIEQPVLRLPVTLQPGENTIAFETEIPYPILEQGAFTGIGYVDLNIKVLESGTDIAVDYSPDLVRRSERYGLVTLTSAALRSFLRVTNNGVTPRRAELAFKYQLKVSDEAKKAGYEKEIRYLDAQIGLLLDHLRQQGLYEKSIFLVMGDHGEGLGEYRSHFGHIHYLNKVYTHVPFILSGKNVPKGGVRSKLVSNFSVAPTLLGLIGAGKPAHMAGSDALDSAVDPKLFLETYSPEAYFDTFSVVHFPWQIIFHPGKPQKNLEFYDLSRDRFGTEDLQPEPDPSGQRSEMINSVLKISRIITASKRNRDRLNQTTMDTLKSLGYL